MHVLTTCKNDEDLNTNEDAKRATKLYIDFSDAYAQLTL